MARSHLAYTEGPLEGVEQGTLILLMDVWNEAGTPRPMGGQGPMGGAVGARGAGDIGAPWGKAYVRPSRRTNHIGARLLHPFG